MVKEFKLRLRVTLSSYYIIAFYWNNLNIKKKNYLKLLYYHTENCINKIIQTDAYFMKKIKGFQFIRNNNIKVKAINIFYVKDIPNNKKITKNVLYSALSKNVKIFYFI